MVLIVVETLVVLNPMKALATSIGINWGPLSSPTSQVEDSIAKSGCIVPSTINALRQYNYQSNAQTIVFG